MPEGTLTAGIAAAMGGGLPARILAAEGPRNAFNADNVADALKAIYGTGSANDSNAIPIKPPTETANGATVLVSVSTILPDVDFDCHYCGRQSTTFRNKNEFYRCRIYYEC